MTTPMKVLSFSTKRNTAWPRVLARIVSRCLLDLGRADLIDGVHAVAAHGTAEVVGEERADSSHV
jgi:hypothetical protein